MSPSARGSFTPVTTTVCGVSQLAGVKVRLDAETVPSVRSELDRLIETLAVGALFSTTVKLAVPPASVVDRPDVGVTVTPGPVGRNQRAKTPSASPAPLPLQTAT